MHKCNEKGNGKKADPDVIEYHEYISLIYIILCTLVGMIISWIVYFMSKTFGKISELKIPADKKELQL
ncbi:MAG: hypothetical protein UHS32_02245, partial [Bacteroidaceae bacterium]|nr:hypothetical protein [Bacteroidaceae bacterium]